MHIVTRLMTPDDGVAIGAQYDNVCLVEDEAGHILSAIISLPVPERRDERITCTCPIYCDRCDGTGTDGNPVFTDDVCSLCGGNERGYKHTVDGHCILCGKPLWKPECEA